MRGDGERVDAYRRLSRMNMILRGIGVFGAGILLAACSPQPITSTKYLGKPSDAPSDGAHSDGVWAVWHGATLELALTGSSSCPTEPVGITVTGHAAIKITTHATTGGSHGCTSDLGPTTWVIDVPEKVRDGDLLTVTVAGGPSLQVHRS